MDYICSNSSTLNCDYCYESSVKSCSDEIVLQAGLTAITSYYWIIENKFGQLFQRVSETDNTGKLTIDVTVLPEGSSNPFSGPFNLSIREGANYLNVIDLAFGDNIFKCVQFKFIDVDDDPDNPYNVIK